MNSYRLRKRMAIFSLGWVAVILSCASEERAWRETERVNTVESYENFLERYPNGDFAPSADENLWSLLHAQAREANTIEAYEGLLSRAPSEQLRTEIQAEAEPLYANEAKALGTIQAYETFLTRYPEGRFSEEIGQILSGLRLVEAISQAIANPNRILVVKSSDSSYECFAVEDIVRQEGPKIFLKAGADIAVGTMAKGPPQKIGSTLADHLIDPPPGGHFLTINKNDGVMVRGFVGITNKELEIDVTEIVL